MLREQSQLIVKAHKLLDISLTAIAFIAAYYAKRNIVPLAYRGLITAPNYYIVLLMAIIIWYLIFEHFDLYVSYRSQKLSQVILKMIKAVCAGMLALILCMYLFKIDDVSRIMLGIFFLLDITLLGFSKGVAYKIMSHYWQRGANFRNLIVIGSKERAKEVIKAITEQKSSGYKVMGCLDTDEKKIGREVTCGIKIIGTIDKLQAFLTEDVVDEVIFAMPLDEMNNPAQYLAIAEELGIHIRIIPDWQINKFMDSPKIARIRFDQFSGLHTMSLSTTSDHKTALLLKTAFDYVFAGATSIVLLPVFLLIACAIKFTSKGPIFFKQERYGLNGRKFMLYKFRTMVADAEARRQEVESLNETDGPVFKVRKDPRIIPYVGTFLRMTGVDELPQLLNVLRSEMSLIGPRPPLPAEVEQYEMWQRRRLSMKPGLTGLWQATSHRNDVSFEQWMKMDLKYIDNWSFGLDLKIFAKTVLVMLVGMGR